MKILLRKTAILWLCCLQLSCTGNVFSEMGSKTSDEAILVDARTALNSEDYQVAIDLLLNNLSAEGQQKTEAKELLAGGYAGLCGLNFLNFINALSSSNGTSAFGITSSIFVGTTVNPDACLTALSTMETIGPVSSRTVSQNVFAAIAGMSLMGSATRLYTDNSPTGGNGTQDSANVSCGLTDAQVDQIILGFGYMTENLSYLSASQLGTTGSAFNSVIAACASLGGISCSIKDPASITNPVRIGFRKLLNTTEYGVGTVVSGGNPVVIATACP